MNNVFYIIGSARSGSSLIYNALCSNINFNPAIPENHLVSFFLEAFNYQLSRNNDKEKDYIFNNSIETEKYFKECLVLLYKKIIKKYNCNYLLLKSISLTPNFHILNKFFPDINYIFIVRDPRDIISSMIKVGQEQEKNKIKNQYCRNINDLCDHINESYQLILINKFKNLFEKKVYIVKYENFVNNFSYELNNICKKFSLKTKYSDNINVWSKASEIYKDKIKNNTGYFSDLWNKPITNKKIGNYRNILTQDEIEIINNKCNHLLKKFKYID